MKKSLRLCLQVVLMIAWLSQDNAQPMIAGIKRAFATVTDWFRGAPADDEDALKRALAASAKDARDRAKKDLVKASTASVSDTASVDESEDSSSDEEEKPQQGRKKRHKAESTPAPTPKEEPKKPLTKKEKPKLPAPQQKKSSVGKKSGKDETEADDNDEEKEGKKASGKSGKKKSSKKSKPRKPAATDNDDDDDDGDESDQTSSASGSLTPPAPKKPAKSTRIKSGSGTTGAVGGKAEEDSESPKKSSGKKKADKKDEPKGTGKSGKKESGKKPAPKTPAPKKEEPKDQRIKNCLQQSGPHGLHCGYYALHHAVEYVRAENETAADDYMHSAASREAFTHLAGSCQRTERSKKKDTDKKKKDKKKDEKDEADEKPVLGRWEQIVYDYRLREGNDRAQYDYPINVNNLTSAEIEQIIQRRFAHAIRHRFLLISPDHAFELAEAVRRVNISQAAPTADDKDWATINRILPRDGTRALIIQFLEQCPWNNITVVDSVTNILGFPQGRHFRDHLIGCIERLRRGVRQSVVLNTGNDGGDAASTARTTHWMTWAVNRRDLAGGAFHVSESIYDSMRKIEYNERLNICFATLLTVFSEIRPQMLFAKKQMVPLFESALRFQRNAHMKENDQEHRAYLVQYIKEFLVGAPVDRCQALVTIIREVTEEKTADDEGKTASDSKTKGTAAKKAPKAESKKPKKPEIKDIDTLKSTIRKAIDSLNPQDDVDEKDAEVYTTFLQQILERCGRAFPDLDARLMGQERFKTFIEIQNYARRSIDAPFIAAHAIASRLGLSEHDFHTCAQDCGWDQEFVAQWAPGRKAGSSKSSGGDDDEDKDGKTARRSSGEKKDAKLNYVQIPSLQQPNDFECGLFSTFNLIKMKQTIEAQKSFDIGQINFNTKAILMEYEAWRTTMLTKIPAIKTSYDRKQYLGGLHLEQLLALSIVNNKDAFETLENIFVVEEKNFGKPQEDAIKQEGLLNNIYRFRDEKLPQYVLVCSNAHWTAHVLFPNNHVASLNSLNGYYDRDGQFETLLNTIYTLFSSTELPKTRSERQAARRKLMTPAKPGAVVIELD